MDFCHTTQVKTYLFACFISVFAQSRSNENQLLQVYCLTMKVIGLSLGKRASKIVHYKSFDYTPLVNKLPNGLASAFPNRKSINYFSNSRKVWSG